MYKVLFVLIIQSILFMACDKNDDKLIDITDQCIFQEEILSPCFDGVDNIEYNELVIKTNKAYENLQDSLRINPVNVDCDTAEFPAIDFTRYTLVAKLTSGSGCEANYERKLFRDDKNKTFIYQVKANYSGECKIFIVNRNWAYIPKVPENYTIEFPNIQ